MRSTRFPRGARLWRVAGAALVLGAAALPPSLQAGNGDVVSISTVLAEPTPKDITDIAFDSSPNPPGGSFWVVGRLTGKIYHLSADLQTLLGEVPNPHGTGSIPNFILTWGVAYRPTTKSLFVMAQNQGKWLVKEVLTATGADVPGGAFEIQLPPDSSDANLRGLTYDSINQQLWYLDSQNERVVRTDLAGVPTQQFSLPRGASDAVLRGEGLCFEIEQTSPTEFVPRIYVAYGDIFRKNPSRIIQLTTDGVPTGIEVPLLSVDLPELRGFQTQRIGLQRRIDVVSSNGKIAQIEQVIPKPVPPSELDCVLTLSNKVALTWRNNGAVSTPAYEGEIVVLRNGSPLTTLQGTETFFTDPTPLQGKSSYSLRASDAPGGALSPPSAPCEVTVGSGGLVDWVPFAGTAIYDVARDPSNGDIFVTDSVGTQDQGRIVRYDADLNVVGEVPSPALRPGPIAFVTSIVIQGVTLENVLAVGRTDGMLLRIIGLDGSVKTTLSLENGGPLAGSLTYIPATQQFALLDPQAREIRLFDTNGKSVGSCSPSPVLGIDPLDFGITYDAIEDSFLAVLEKGTVEEFYSGKSCAPKDGFSFPLDALGEGYDLEGSIGGVQIAGNTLIVAGIETNALYKVLIYPYSPEFRRGDFDRNEQVNLTDAVALAEYLFRAGPAPTCQDAADANDDGILDVSDPIYLLFHLFLDGPPPPPPYPEPGTDPSFRDNLGCGE